MNHYLRPAQFFVFGFILCVLCACGDDADFATACDSSSNECADAQMGYVGDSALGETSTDGSADVSESGDLGVALWN
jgi:hypothetical protein